VNGQGDGGFAFDLRVVNIETGQVTHVWPNTFYNFAYDASRQQFLVCGETKKRVENQQITVGNYFVRLSGSATKAGDGCLYNLDDLGWKGAVFVGSRAGESVTIDQAGKTTHLSDQGQGKFSLSPDRKWLVFYNEQQMNIFAEPGQLVQTITTGARTVKWTPDSSGLWIESQGLYSLSVSDWKLKPVKCALEICGGSLSSSVWLP
jgi:hypothetical protein